MEPKIRADYKAAIKSKDAPAKRALSLLISAIDNEKISLKRELTEDEILKTIIKECKKRNQSIEAYTLAKRLELTVKEEEELVVLESYLPKPLTYSELQVLVRNFKNEFPGIHEGKLFGLVNKETKGTSKAEDIKKAISES